MDIAALGFSIDSAQALAATRNLDAMVASADRAGAAHTRMQAAAMQQERQLQELVRQQQAALASLQQTTQATAGLADGFRLMAEEAAKASKAIEGLARPIGAGNVEFRNFSQALGAAGATINTQAQAFQRFSTALNDTSLRARDLRESFARIGVDLAKFKPGQEVEALRETVVQLGKYRDGYEKTQAIQRIFGDSSAETFDLLTKQIRTLTAEQKALNEATEALGRRENERAAARAAADAETKALERQRQAVEDLGKTYVALAAQKLRFKWEDYIEDKAALGDVLKASLDYAKQVVRPAWNGFVDTVFDTRQFVNNFGARVEAWWTGDGTNLFQRIALGVETMFYKASGAIDDAIEASAEKLKKTIFNADWWNKPLTEVIGFGKIEAPDTTAPADKRPKVTDWDTQIAEWLQSFQKLKAAETQAFSWSVASEQTFWAEKLSIMDRSMSEAEKRESQHYERVKAISAAANRAMLDQEKALLQAQYSTDSSLAGSARERLRQFDVYAGNSMLMGTTDVERRMLQMRRPLLERAVGDEDSTLAQGGIQRELELLRQRNQQANRLDQERVAQSRLTQDQMLANMQARVAAEAGLEIRALDEGIKRAKENGNVVAEQQLTTAREVASQRLQIQKAELSDRLSQELEADRAAAKERIRLLKDTQAIQVFSPLARDQAVAGEQLAGQLRRKYAEGTPEFSNAYQAMKPIQDEELAQQRINDLTRLNGELDRQLQAEQKLTEAVGKGAAATKEYSIEKEVQAKRLELTGSLTEDQRKKLKELLETYDAELKSLSKEKDAQEALLSVRQRLRDLDIERLRTGEARSTDPDEINALRLRAEQQAEINRLTERYGDILDENAQKELAAFNDLQAQRELTRFWSEVRSQAESVSRDISNFLTDGFVNALEGGKSTFASFFDGLLAMGKRFVARLVATFLEQKIFLPITMGVIGSAAGMFGIASPQSVGGGVMGLAQNAGTSWLSQLMPNPLTSFLPKGFLNPFDGTNFLNFSGLFSGLTAGGFAAPGSAVASQAASLGIGETVTGGYGGIFGGGAGAGSGAGSSMFGAAGAAGPLAVAAAAIIALHAAGAFENKQTPRGNAQFGAIGKNGQFTAGQVTALDGYSPAAITAERDNALTAINGLVTGYGLKLNVPAYAKSFENWGGLGGIGPQFGFAQTGDEWLRRLFAWNTNAGRAAGGQSDLSQGVWQLEAGIGTRTSGNNDEGYRTIYVNEKTGEEIDSATVDSQYAAWRAAKEGAFGTPGSLFSTDNKTLQVLLDRMSMGQYAAKDAKELGEAIGYAGNFDKLKQQAQYGANSKEVQASAWKDAAKIAGETLKDSVTKYIDDARKFFGSSAPQVNEAATTQRQLIFQQLGLDPSGNGPMGEGTALKGRDAALAAAQIQVESFRAALLATGLTAEQVTQYLNNANAAQAATINRQFDESDRRTAVGFAQRDKAAQMALGIGGVDAQALAREALVEQQRQEMYDAEQAGMSKANLERLRYIQGLEREAQQQAQITANRQTAQGFAERQNSARVTLHMMGSDEAETEAMLFRQQQERDAARTSGMSAANREMLIHTQGLEREALAYQQAERYLQKQEGYVSRTGQALAGMLQGSSVASWGQEISEDIDRQIKQAQELRAATSDAERSRIREIQVLEDTAVIAQRAAEQQQKHNEALKAAKDQIEAFRKSISGWLDQQKLTQPGGASIAEGYQEAQRQYDEQLAKVKAGDTDAMQTLTQYADRYIQAAEAMYTGSGPANVDAARQVYEALVERARKGDVEALSQVQQAADNYKTIAQQTYASGTAYQDIRQSIIEAMKDLPAQLDPEQMAAKAIEKLNEDIVPPTKEELDVIRSLERLSMATKTNIGLSNGTLDNMKIAADMFYAAQIEESKEANRIARDIRSKVGAPATPAPPPASTGPTPSQAYSELVGLASTVATTSANWQAAGKTDAEIAQLIEAQYGGYRNSLLNRMTPDLINQFGQLFWNGVGGPGPEYARSLIRQQGGVPAFADGGLGISAGGPGTAFAAVLHHGERVHTTEQAWMMDRMAADVARVSDWMGRRQPANDEVVAAIGALKVDLNRIGRALVTVQAEILRATEAGPEYIANSFASSRREANRDNADREQRMVQAK